LLDPITGTGTVLIEKICPYFRECNCELKVTILEPFAVF
jgi:hypothetical protein